MEELAREAVLQAIASFDDRGPEEFFGHYGVTRDRSYFIRHNGQEYDMKAVIRVALGPVLRLIDFASRLRRRLPGFVFAGALPPPCRPDDGPGSGLFTLAVPFPAFLPTGKSRISQVPWRSIP